MKWKYFLLAENDVRARSHILANLSVGGMEHTLTKELLARFSEATGPMTAIAFETLDLALLPDFEYATYSGGKQWFEEPGARDVPQSDCPIGGLILFIENYLRSAKDAVVLCEKCGDTRTKYLANWRPRESPVVFYQEEIYHIVTSEDDNYDAIECAVRESTSHWATGVCSSRAVIPQGDIATKTFLDDIVANTAHIFTSAFDGEGYLVWSPSG